MSALQLQSILYPEDGNLTDLFNQTISMGIERLAQETGARFSQTDKEELFERLNPHCQTILNLFRKHTEGIGTKGLEHANEQVLTEMYSEQAVKNMDPTDEDTEELVTAEAMFEVIKAKLS